jgi:hypothetical protein
VIPNDATEHRFVMLAVDMPVGENVAPHVHGRWNRGDEIARVFEIYTPGGFDLLYERVGEIVASGRQPTRDDFRRIDEERRQA